MSQRKAVTKKKALAYKNASRSGKSQILDALEDAADVDAFDAAMAQEGENIPWAQVKADLGWS